MNVILQELNSILGRVQAFDERGMHFTSPSVEDLEYVKEMMQAKFSLSLTASDPDDGRDCEVFIVANDEVAQPELWHRLSIHNDVRKKARLAFEFLKRCPNDKPSESFVKQFDDCRRIS